MIESTSLKEATDVPKQKHFKSRKRQKKNWTNCHIHSFNRYQYCSLSSALLDGFYFFETNGRSCSVSTNFLP